MQLTIMKVVEWLSSYSQRAVDACVWKILIAFFVIADWRIAAAGGFSILGNFIPIWEFHYICYLVCLAFLMLMLIALVISRKYLSAVFAVIVVLGFLVRIDTVSDQDYERARDSAKHSLDLLLSNIDVQKVQFSSPAVKERFLSSVNGAKLSFKLTRFSYIHHSYVFEANANLTSFAVNIRLGRTGTEYFIYEPGVSRP
ncbi:MAG: hypothetical protein RJA63_730 [Pseudomonadota bacterium]|jgi:hypothetical protein